MPAIQSFGRKPTPKLKHTNTDRIVLAADGLVRRPACNGGQGKAVSSWRSIFRTTRRKMKREEEKKALVTSGHPAGCRARGSKATERVGERDGQTFVESLATWKIEAGEILCGGRTKRPRAFPEPTSQQELPSWMPPWPMWMEITSRGLRAGFGRGGVS